MERRWQEGCDRGSTAVRLSISLSEADVAALDEHVRAAGLPSRSQRCSEPSGY